MTVERAKLAFKLDEDVIYTVVEKRFKIVKIEISRKQRRSLVDRLERKDELIHTFVLKAPGCTYYVDASQLDETRPEPPEELKHIVLLNLAGL